VALTEVEELRLLFSVADQVPATRWRGVCFDVASRSDGDVEVALLASRAVQVGEEVSDAGCAMREVRGIERKRHVGHHQPVGAAFAVDRHFDQPVSGLPCPLQRVWIEPVPMCVEEADAGACRADAEVEHFAFAGDAGDVGEGNRFDPADACAHRICLTSHLAYEPRRGVSEYLVAGHLGQLVEDEGVARAAAVDRD